MPGEYFEMALYVFSLHTIVFFSLIFLAWYCPNNETRLKEGRGLLPEVGGGHKLPKSQKLVPSIEN